MVDLNKDAYTEYQFDGQTLKFGDIIVDTKGRKYRVLTKKAPINVKGKLKINIQPLEGLLRNENIENLNGYRLESQFESASQPENPDAFRLKRVNELNRIYAKENREQGETPEQAKERLKQFLYNTSKEAFQNGVTIKITKNRIIDVLNVLLNVVFRDLLIISSLFSPSFFARKFSRIRSNTITVSFIE